MSAFSESKGDIADAMEQEAVEGPVHGDQLAVIHERADSDDAASAASTQSMGKMYRQAPGCTKRVRVRKHPPHRMPCPGRISVLVQTIRGYANKLGKAGLQMQKSAKRCMKVVMARLVKESEGTSALRANDVQENHLGIQRAVHGDEHDRVDRVEDDKRGNAVGLEEMKAERHEQVSCVELQEVVAEHDPDAAPDADRPPAGILEEYEEYGAACLCDDGSEDEDEVSSCKPKRRPL